MEHQMLSIESNDSIPEQQRSIIALVKTSGRLVLEVALVLFLGYAVMEPFNRPNDLGVDGSWRACLGAAFANHFQVGKDYVFTYGPLAALQNDSFDANLYWSKYFWQLTIDLILSLYIIRFISRNYGLAVAAVFCLFVPMIPRCAPDVFPFFALALMGIDGLRQPSLSLRKTVFFTLFLCLFSLEKFPLLLFSHIILGLWTVKALGERKWLAAFRPLAAFVFSFLAAWSILGQSVLNIPNFLYGSLQLSLGYTGAMALAGPHFQLYLAFLVALVLMGTALPLRQEVWIKPAFWSGTILLGSAGFFLWKEGFVRQDAHAFSFFSFTQLVPFLLPAAFPGNHWKAIPRHYGLCLGSLLSVYGIVSIYGAGSPATFTDPAFFWNQTRHHFAAVNDQIFAPGELKQQMQDATTFYQLQCSLPKLSALVHDEPIDCFSNQQNVLLLNQLHWQPRPVFQSYCAFTPYLESLNRQFYSRAGRPKYVLFNNMAIDNHLLALEDGPAFLEICNHYVPVDWEKGWLLLEDHNFGSAAQPAETALAWEKTIEFDEEIPIQHQAPYYQTLAIAMDFSRKGRVRNTFFRLPHLSISVRTRDRLVHQFHYIPGMGQEGFLIDPLITSNEDLLQFYQGSANGEVVSFWLSTPPEAKKYYKAIHAVLKKTPRPAPGTQEHEKLSAMLASYAQGFADPLQEMGQKEGVSADEVTPGKTVIMVGEKAAERDLVGGWGTADPDGRWTTGKSATLRFQVDPGQGRQLKLRSHPFLVSGKIEKQHLQVCLNGVSVGTYILDKTDWTILSIDLPSQLLRKDNAVTLDLPDATSPNRVSDIPDGRPLALFVNSFWLE